MELFEEPKAHYNQVTCLGKTFKNEEERREHFTALLREKLKDPEFRKIDGFPIGEDEDILALSDPPFYTACPNPWISDFISEWNSDQISYEQSYHHEPFAADVKEGKYHPIYKYHPYPTKVPHRAIMRYILHYTEPGDIVFDGFCGTGMTGVAAFFCGDKNEVLSLGYQVKPDGTILREDQGEKGNSVWTPFSKLGIRRCVLNDLSPAATFISYNYNTPVFTESFSKEVNRILGNVEKETLWMYETKHTNGGTGKINYMVWSDVFICPNCSKEIIFWDAAVDKTSGVVHEDFPCPYCSSILSKEPVKVKNGEIHGKNKNRPHSFRIDRQWITFFDDILNRTVKQAKQVPVFINYNYGNRRFEKTPDQFDLDLIKKIDKIRIPYWVPSDTIPKGDKTGEPIRVGITNVHHFYSKRNLYSLASFLDKISDSKQKLFLTKLSYQITKLYRFTYQSGVWGAGGGPLSGTFYIPSLNKELHILKQFRSALKSRSKISTCAQLGSFIGSTESTTSMPFLKENSIDYIFIDPPFGSNLNYSELAFLWESWLKIKTNNKEEAIENKNQKKTTDDYRQLMTRGFKTAYNALKPGGWVTVEFSNTKAKIWNSIQTSLVESGFVVSNVSALNKKKKSYNAQTNPTSVKQDLVISAYKPNGGFENRFKSIALSAEGVWDFIRTHLKYLPIIKVQNDTVQIIPERDPRILFDQMVAYYVLKGYSVPVSSQEFQIGLSQMFIERDSMFFLPEQVAEYDKKRLLYGGSIQTSLFVSDENSAIHWLRDRLRSKPQIYSDIHPEFTPLLSHLNSNEKELIDLNLLLEQNFLKYDGNGPVPEQIHSYLSSNWKELRNLDKEDESLKKKAIDRWFVPDPNKQSDLEKIREKSLLKEFEVYLQSNKKLRVFRLEVIRAGFKNAWQIKDYDKIIKVAKLIPTNILDSDPKLLLWYDQAQTRLGGE